MHHQGTQRGITLLSFIIVLAVVGFFWVPHHAALSDVFGVLQRGHFDEEVRG